MVRDKVRLGDFRLDLCFKFGGGGFLFVLEFESTLYRSRELFTFILEFVLGKNVLKLIIFFSVFVVRFRCILIYLFA